MRAKPGWLVVARVVALALALLLTYGDRMFLPFVALYGILLGSDATLWMEDR
jgi:hypothetical protein